MKQFYVLVVRIIQHFMTRNRELNERYLAALCGDEFFEGDSGEAKAPLSPRR
ncbi:MAG: hypothetical protein ACYC9D_12240 [Candidatus Dormibacteria bacterium]